MKVYIGPYLTWIGPYQIAGALRWLGVPKRRCQLLGAWLDSTWVGPFLNQLYAKRKRAIRVKYHDWDCVSLDTTLAHIILPGLIRMRDLKNGTPMIGKTTDVPPELWPTTEDWHLDGGDQLEARWAYILNEMIWAFGNVLDYEVEIELSNLTGGDMQVYDAHQARIANGLRLFGTYYRSLWT